MAIHFIADLHLTDDADPNAQRLAGYLAGPARGADALYVLGDLFDVWIGDDGSMPRHATTIAAFGALTDSGVPACFMRGNRDFAIGERFSAASGLRVLDDPTIIDLYGTPTLLTHGDMLCTDDAAHQAFRARYTDPAWRARMLKVPLWLRRLIAIWARRRSRAGKIRKPAAIMDVNTGTVRQTMAEYAVPRLIHGHTHRPADHPVHNGDAAARRHVIADWRTDQAEVLIADADGIRRAPLTSTGEFR